MHICSGVHGHPKMSMKRHCSIACPMSDLKMENLRCAQDVPSSLGF